MPEPRSAAPNPADPTTFDRRSLLRLGAVSAVAAPAAKAGPPFELDEATVTDLRQRLDGGRETALSLVEKYLARIEAVDRRGPGLRSVIEVNPEAREIARARDAERKAGGAPRGPLHGIPVLIKDNIATADKMSTSAGSLALAGFPAPADAFLVRKLRAAGAVIIGKTNLSEWANFRSTRSTSGWSARGGQCRNPYALDRNTSGSSSGSGAAVAANLCAVAVGTETDGSIVSPSSTCGLVGLKPTLGLVSRAGIVPIAHSQDTAGPMTRTVADAAVLLGILAGPDPADPITTGGGSGAPGKRPATLPADYTRYLDRRGLEGARIGVPRKEIFGGGPLAAHLIEAAIADMKKLGAVIVDPANVETAASIGDDEMVVLFHEFKADLNAYLAGLGERAPVKTLADLIAWNEKNRAREMPFFGQELFEKAQAAGPLSSPRYRRALASNQRKTRAQGIDAVMDKHRLDALVAPTSGPAWLIDLVNGDYSTGGSSSVPAVAGYPHITVPAGFAFGLPVGLSFIGRAWAEPTLIKLAYAYEQATKHRRPPGFLATAPLPTG